MRFAALLGLIALSACARPDVVIYCAADQEYAEPILKEFEKSSGLKVQSVFDVEATKTVGLVQTLLEEKPHPRCDVFWNNEPVHTIRLKSAGVLAPYKSPSAADVPAALRDPDGFWTGIAARG